MSSNDFLLHSLSPLLWESKYMHVICCSLICLRYQIRNKQTVASWTNLACFLRALYLQMGTKNGFYICKSLYKIKRKTKKNMQQREYCRVLFIYYLALYTKTVLSLVLRNGVCGCQSDQNLRGEVLERRKPYMDGACKSAYQFPSTSMMLRLGIGLRGKDV